MERRKEIDSGVVPILYESPYYISNPPSSTNAPNLNIIANSDAHRCLPSLINPACDVTTTHTTDGLGYMYGAAKLGALTTTNPLASSQSSPKLCQRLHEHGREVGATNLLHINVYARNTDNAMTTTSFPHVVTTDVDACANIFVSRHDDQIQPRDGRPLGSHRNRAQALLATTSTLMMPPPYPQDNFNQLLPNATSTRAKNAVSSYTPLRKGTPSYRQTHINSERQRRKAMSNLFTTLYSLIPFRNILKPDRCTIVNYVINYVEYLQGKISDLTKVRAQLELDIESRENYASTTFRSQGISHCDKNIHKGNRHEGHEHLKGKEYRNGAQVPFSASVRYWGSMDIFISLRFPKRRGVWPDVLGLLEETFAIDVQCATFSSASNVCLHSIYAKVDKTLSVEELQIAIMDFLHLYFK